MTTNQNKIVQREFIARLKNANLQVAQYGCKITLNKNYPEKPFHLKECGESEGGLNRWMDFACLEDCIDHAAYWSKSQQKNLLGVLKK